MRVWSRELGVTTGAVGVRRSAFRRRRDDLSLAASPTFQVSVLESLASVAPAEWDAVSAPALERSHAYLSAIAAAGIAGCDYFYVLVRDATGTLVAHASAYTVRTDFAQLLPPGLAALIRRLRRWWPRLLSAQAVECAAPLVAGHGLSLCAGAPRALVLELIERALSARARQEGCRLVVIHAFRRDECAGVDSLRALGYQQVRNLPLARVRVRWPDYAAYLGAMRARYRTDVRRRLKRAAAAGQQVRRIGQFAGYAELCATQAAQVQAQAAGFKRERLGPDYYRALDEALGPASVLLAIERDGRMVAHGLILLGERELIATYFGRDAGPARNEWFQLMNEALRLALERGVTSINLGRGSYEAKALVGADIEPLYCYARSTFAPVNWLMRVAPGIAWRQRLRELSIFRT